MGKLKITKELKRLKKLKIKLSKEKRKKRKEKLIKLGTLFYICNLLEVEQETMLGYLISLKKINLEKIKELEKLGEKVLDSKPNLKYPETLLEKKKLFWKMIRKSALLEKIKLDKFSPKAILGYLNNFNNISEEKLEEYKQIGSSLLKRKIENATDTEKMLLLKMSILKKIDISKMIKEKFKTDIHNITVLQYQELRKELDKF
ncbi:hypothetical protein [Fusobacterium sp. HC1336]|uniref:hypothetical protein n=1 Tax=Fusobacterium sp. HC1336 TaxID=3171169 RepID=UPI003F26F471